MNARVELEKEGEPTRVVKQENTPTPASLWTPGPHPHARVGMQAGTQVDFGRVKITAYVELECNQDEKTLNEAGLQAFNKAVEFMRDGLTLLLDEPGTPP